MGEEEGRLLFGLLPDNDEHWPICADRVYGRDVICEADLETEYMPWNGLG